MIPRVGVVVIVQNDKNEILLGYRKNINLGHHTWGPPGGKLEFGEELENCAVRELKEETNLTVDINSLNFAGVSNSIFDEKTQYISIFYEVYISEKEISNLKIAEPDKCEEWKFFSIDNLPENLFLPFKNLHYEKNKIYLSERDLNTFYDVVFGDCIPNQKLIDASIRYKSQTSN